MEPFDDTERVDTGLVAASEDPRAIRSDSDPEIAVAAVPVDGDTGSAGPDPIRDSVPVPDPQIVREATKALVGALPADFDHSKMAKLAREIAMDIRERHVIIKEYGLNQNQYDFLCQTPFYAKALDTAILEWNSSLSTTERIRLEAAAILEDALPHLGARMQRLSEGMPGVVEAGKLFAKIAGLDTPERGAGNAPGERFRITINLGGDVVRHTSEPKDITPARSAAQVLIDSEG